MVDLVILIEHLNLLLVLHPNLRLGHVVLGSTCIRLCLRPRLLGCEWWDRNVVFNLCQRWSEHVFVPIINWLHGDSIASNVILLLALFNNLIHLIFIGNDTLLLNLWTWFQKVFQRRLAIVFDYLTTCLLCSLNFENFLINNLIIFLRIHCLLFALHIYLLIFIVRIFIVLIKLNHFVYLILDWMLHFILKRWLR